MAARHDVVLAATQAEPQRWSPEPGRFDTSSAGLRRSACSIIDSGTCGTNPFRPATVVFLSLCVWTAVSVPSHGQQLRAAAVSRPARGARSRTASRRRRRRSRARGPRTIPPPSRCSRISRSRGPVRRGDRGAAACRAARAAQRSRARAGAAAEAARATRPARVAAADRCCSGNPRTTRRRSSAPARAAAALGRMRDANSLFRAAAASGPDPGGRDGVGRAVPRDRTTSAEALKSFQQALTQDRTGRRRTSALARTLANENPPAAAAAAEQALKIDPQPRRRAAVPRRARSRQHPLRRGARADRPRAQDATRRTSTRGRCSAPSPTSATTSRRSRRKRSACSPSTRRSARSIASPAIWRRATIASTRRCADAARARARSGEHPRAERSRPAPDAHRRRGRGAARRSTARSRRSLRPGDVQPARRCSTSSRSSRSCRTAISIFKFDPDEAKVLREYAIPLAQDALKKLSADVPVHAEGADPRSRSSRSTTTSPSATSACPGSSARSAPASAAS